MGERATIRVDELKVTETGHFLAILTESSKIRELDRGQAIFVFIVEGFVTLELTSSATLDTVPSPPYRARHPSVSRLKDA